jgi:hypothetical protein
MLRFLAAMSGGRGGGDAFLKQQTYTLSFLNHRPQSSIVKYTTAASPVFLLQGTDNNYLIIRILTTLLSVSILLGWLTSRGRHWPVIASRAFSDIISGSAFEYCPSEKKESKLLSVINVLQNDLNTVPTLKFRGYQLHIH